jgi:hypothetical protein
MLGTSRLVLYQKYSHKEMIIEPWGDLKQAHSKLTESIGDLPLYILSVHVQHQTNCLDTAVCVAQAR